MKSCCVTRDYNNDRLVVLDGQESSGDLGFDGVLDAQISRVGDLCEVLHEEVALESFLQGLKWLAGGVFNAVKEAAHARYELDVAVGQSAVVLELDVVGLSDEQLELGLEVRDESAQRSLLEAETEHAVDHHFLRTIPVQLRHLAHKAEQIHRSMAQTDVLLEVELLLHLLEHFHHHRDYVLERPHTECCRQLIVAVHVPWVAHAELAHGLLLAY